MEGGQAGSAVMGDVKECLELLEIVNDIEPTLKTEVNAQPSNVNAIVTSPKANLGRQHKSSENDLVV